MKSYGYTLYFTDGTKLRQTVSETSEENADTFVKRIAKVREDVEFATLDSLDMPCDYDWDEDCKAWQSRMF